MLKVSLKDKSSLEVEKGTTILEVAKKISEGLARNATCGEVDGEVKDLRYELQKDCNLVIHTFQEEDLEGKKAYWHTTSHIMAQAVKRLFPDVKFAIIDDATIELDNVTCLMFEQEQGSYLVGYVAGMMTETDNVGFVIGMSNENMNLFGYGYCAGVLDANPDATIQQFNVNSFADSATGKSMANTAITNGADIVFHAAGASGLGVIEACQEAGVYAIGVDSDQSSIAPETVITSAMKRVDNAVYDSVESLINGTLEGGVVTYDLSMGGVDIAPTQDLLPEEVISAVEDVKQQIIDGEIVVPNDQASFEAAHGDVYELD